MLKLIGIVMILISDFFIVKFILDTKKKEIEFIKDTITFLKCMSIQIIDLKKTLSDAILNSRGNISNEIDNIIDSFFKMEKSPRENIINIYKNNPLIDENTKKTITEYLNIAGRTTKEGMEDFLGVTVNNLTYILNGKIEQNKNTKKTVNVCVYSLSIFFVILII